MAQQCTVIQGDPQTLATSLQALAGNVLIVEKSSSSGKFIVIYDTQPEAQNFQVIMGDPEKVASEINALTLSGADPLLIISTFSASHYVVVSR
jgi:hypothetical protein